MIHIEKESREERLKMMKILYSNKVFRCSRHLSNYCNKALQSMGLDWTYDPTKSLCRTHHLRLGLHDVFFNQVPSTGKDLAADPAYL